MKPELFEDGIKMQNLDKRKSFDSSNTTLKPPASPTRSHDGHINQKSFKNLHDTINVDEWMNGIELGVSNITTNALKKLKRYNRNSKDIEKQSPITPLSSPGGFYIAMYYGTDDDFLMKSSVRLYFKENALEDGDNLLFTLATQNDSNLDPHPTLPNFLYAVEDGEWGGYKDSWVFWIALLTYTATGSLVIKFLVPDTYAVVASFSLVFTIFVAVILLY